MMGLRRTPLVLYILFVFHLHHDFTSVSSRSYSLDTNKESLHVNESKPVVDVFEGKARELAFVIKRRGIGGAGGGGGSTTSGGDGGSSGSSTSGGGGGGHSSVEGGGVSGQSWSNGGGRFGSSYAGRNGTRGLHRSSGRQNIRGAVCAAGWLGLSILVGLILA
ncbi:hypothetical protein BRARA_H02936 [Brassica rapa]|uniref:Glycine-rich protein n=1 Tax=Brassica campestris TaxID=3711 RepID=A0A397YFR4_BRACM|nr:loricrin-like [Brassica napus]RID52329.1 hypothetical protein BRARA_H02936 [Brassica rapa]